MTDDITGLRRMFPDANWGSPQHLAIAEDFNALEDFIQSAKTLRQTQGITQQDMADRLDTKQPCISDFERLGGDPRIRTIQRYARALGYKLTLSLEPATPVDVREN